MPDTSREAQITACSVERIAGKSVSAKALKLFSIYKTI